MMVLRMSLIVTGFLLGLSSASRGENFNTLVDLRYSKYRGIEGPSNVTHWWGIRYAAPPLQDLRFRAPRDPISTGDLVILADQHGGICHFSPSTSVNPNHTEDCLFLNVYRPTQKRKQLLPVYLYIQGGGLNTLAAPNLDGTNLIAASGHEIIVVTFNYRVGPWGFLTSKEVRANGDLNVGILDQRKVLEWVQKYISKFGGDPKRVTVGGSSAGAGSIDIHLTAYGGKDYKLFAAVHAESPSFGFLRTIEESQYQYDALVKGVGCDKRKDTLKCLRQLPIEMIVQNNSNLLTPGGGGGFPLFLYSTTIDGDLIQQEKHKAFTAGKFIKIPSIYGGDTNEGTVFTNRSISNYAVVNNFLKDNFPKLTASQLAQIDYLYPKAEQFPEAGPYFRTAANAYGDIRYTCPNIFVSSSFSRAEILRTYNYRWDVLNPALAAAGYGVTHTAGVAPTFGLAVPGTDEAKIGQYIQAYILSFIRTSGDPNEFRKAGSAVWTAWDASGMNRMHFPNDETKVGMESVNEEQKEQCSYLSGIGASIGQ